MASAFWQKAVRAIVQPELAVSPANLDIIRKLSNKWENGRFRYGVGTRQTAFLAGLWGGKVQILKWSNFVDS